MTTSQTRVLADRSAGLAAWMLLLLVVISILPR